MVPPGLLFDGSVLGKTKPERIVVLEGMDRYHLYPMHCLLMTSSLHEVFSTFCYSRDPTGDISRG